MTGMAAKKKAGEVRLDRTDGGVSVSMGGRAFSITGQAGAPVLQVTNEYGNSASYDIAHGFGPLWSQLWQFVKDSQH